MINETKCKKVCREHLSLIQNYEEAVNNVTEMWHCHHRLGVAITRKKLMEIGMYYKRPASELIFLKESEHKSLHSKNRHHSEETRLKMSEVRKGVPKSEESRRKISEAMKGNQNADFLKKQVIQLDKTTGEIIKIWSCMMNIQRQLGIAHNSISKCCSGKLKSAGGYVWCYSDN